MPKLFSFLILALCFAGCHVIDTMPAEQVTASYKSGVRVDATMSDPAWKKAQEYRLQCYRSFRRMPDKTAAAIEKSKYWVEASARLLYDDDNLYIGCRIENDDIRTLELKDQLRHYLTGDVIEVFLKPVEANGYFELYATPSGHKSTFFFPSRSFNNTVLIDRQELMPGVEVVSCVDGTLNNPNDIDRSWSTVLTVSRNLLEAKTGVPFDSRHPWTILLAGYSFSQNRIFDTNFSYPQLPVLNYHVYEYYAPLILK